jgi:hypothetical protein
MTYKFFCAVCNDRIKSDDADMLRTLIEKSAFELEYIFSIITYSFFIR